MNKFIFENLDVYQKAVEFANQVFSLSNNFHQINQFSLGEQLRRSALSISSNIAEGAGRKHKKEKKQFFQTALASAFECVPQLKIALLQSEINQEQFSSLYEECFVMSKMLSSLIKSVDVLNLEK